jgi:hypothetical protein
VAFRLLQRDRELACDDVAASATHQPLALAGALAKVWEYTLGGTGTGARDMHSGVGTIAVHAPATALFDGDATWIEHRIKRLLAPDSRHQDTACRLPGVQVLAFGLGSSALAVLLALEAANAAVMLGPMGCGPHAPLVSLLTRLL